MSSGPECRLRKHSVKDSASRTGCSRTTEGDANGMRRAQEVLGDWLDLPTIADGNWAVVAVRVVVGRLLVVLKPLHQREQVVGRPSFCLEVVWGVPRSMRVQATERPTPTPV